VLAKHSRCARKQQGSPSLTHTHTPHSVSCLHTMLATANNKKTVGPWRACLCGHTCGCYCKKTKTYTLHIPVPSSGLLNHERSPAKHDKCTAELGCPKYSILRKLDKSAEKAASDASSASASDGSNHSEREGDEEESGDVTADESYDDEAPKTRTSAGRRKYPTVGCPHTCWCVDNRGNRVLHKQISKHNLNAHAFRLKVCHPDCDETCDFVKFKASLKNLSLSNPFQEKEHMNEPQQTLLSRQQPAAAACAVAPNAPVASPTSSIDASIAPPAAAAAAAASLVDVSTVPVAPVALPARAVQSLVSTASASAHVQACRSPVEENGASRAVNVLDVARASGSTDFSGDYLQAGELVQPLSSSLLVASAAAPAPAPAAAAAAAAAPVNTASRSKKLRRKNTLLDSSAAFPAAAAEASSVQFDTYTVPQSISGVKRPREECKNEDNNGASKRSNRFEKMPSGLSPRAKRCFFRVQWYKMTGIPEEGDAGFIKMPNGMSAEEKWSFYEYIGAMRDDELVDDDADNEGDDLADTVVQRFEKMPDGRMSEGGQRCFFRMQWYRLSRKPVVEESMSAEDKLSFYEYVAAMEAGNLD
jgi:hypothetical protein